MSGEPALRPLSFDRVNDGQLLSSNNALFSLPVELLSEILQHIPRHSLASLALVNRDCRQLARSRQFAGVALHTCRNTLGLLRLLYGEGQERCSNRGRTNSPSLGCCVRRLSVSIIPEKVWKSHQHHQGSNERSEDSQTVRLNETHLWDVLFVVANSLPHLQILDWNDRIGIGKRFFNALIKCSIPHVRLRTILMDGRFQVSFPKRMAGRKWPVQSLQLHLPRKTSGKDGTNNSVMPLTVSLLRLCAPTLESLTWIGNCPQILEPDDLEKNWDLSLLPFTKLRHLRMKSRTLCPSRLECLIPTEGLCDLRSLMVDANDPVIRAFLKKRDTIVSLERLVLDTGFCFYHGDHDDFHENDHDHDSELVDGVVDIIRSNAHVSTLLMICQIASEQLTTRVIPVLRSCSNITSLRVTWKGGAIPDGLLQCISSLKKLESICLRGGDRYTWSNVWRIDHEALRGAFSQLLNLRRIALEGSDGPEGQCFGEDVSIEDQDLANEIIEEIEVEHRLEMLSEANQYLKDMPRQPLEWLHFRRVTMGVRFIDGNRRSYWLTPGLDIWELLIEEMFESGSRLEDSFL